ncbi:YdeI/OmpD-associated family protein [Pseudorhodoferax sp.]|uniref:YdeI/OmpD-associated family protein n=1 Tax=Pseudorhodoferax sp. TaxID=1993553 RepID=UPI002DD654B8|nr:YdeI/OmpD-associated family protein [Pseudorhodoferax sp.]
MKFKARVIPSGNATAVEVPHAVLEKLDAGARPPVVIVVNGHSWRSRVAAMRGMHLIGISAANRQASAVSEGDLVEVQLELDIEPRAVEEPADVAAALDKRKALRAAFDRLPFGLRRKHVAGIEEAKSPETRLRRIARLLGTLEQGAG